MQSDSIRTFFYDRGFQPDRQGLSCILSQLGLSCYDYWELAKATEARDIDDKFHIKKIKWGGIIVVSESCAFFKSNPYKRFIDELTNSNYTLDEIKDLQIKCDNGSNYY